MDFRDTRYARASDGAYIAYQLNGAGDIDVVVTMDIFGNVDLTWEAPDAAAWGAGLMSFSRLILHDRRATGLSSRNVPVPNLETRVSDLRAVMDAAGSDRPVLMGFREGGTVNALLAASDPSSARALVWVYPSARSLWAPDYPWGGRPEYAEADMASLEVWGTREYGEAFLESEALADHEIRDADKDLISLLSRHTATPDVAKGLLATWWETDVRGILPAIQCPTLLVGDPGGGYVDELHYIAERIPNASVFVHPHAGAAELPDLIPDFIKEIRGFLGVEAPRPSLDTILSTVLFTDIVDSTRQQAELGDARWKELVLSHHAVVRQALERWKGVENDTAGDGFYATFDGPARAIRCATEVVERVHELGIEVRAGVHTGECEVIEGKCGGLTVSIGARVASNAGPSEVLVSQTVKDLVAGSGLSFEDAGEHELKGVPDRWHLYRVAG